jgi:hypothetical protein
MKGSGGMPKFEKLTASEVERLKKRRNATQDLSAYLSYLDTLKSGDWGALTLEQGETQRAIKRRLTMASKQKGIILRYKKGDEGRIIFEVK